MPPPRRRTRPPPPIPRPRSKSGDTAFPGGTGVSPVVAGVPPGTSPFPQCPMSNAQCPMGNLASWPSAIGCSMFRFPRWHRRPACCCGPPARNLRFLPPSDVGCFGSLLPRACAAILHPRVRASAVDSALPPSTLAQPFLRGFVEQFMRLGQNAGNALRERAAFEGPG